MTRGEKYLSEILDDAQGITAENIPYTWVLSRTDRTITDYTKHWAKLKPFVARKTLSEVFKFIRLARKFFYESFCSKIDEVFNLSDHMWRLPFVVRYKLAVETPMDVFVSKDEIHLLQAIALVDDAINTFRCSVSDMQTYYAYNDVMGGVKKVISSFSVRMLLQGHFQAQNELSRLMPSHVSPVPIYRYDRRIGAVGKHALRPKSVSGADSYQSHGLIEYNSSQANSAERRLVYTVERKDGTSKMVEIDDGPRFGIDFPSANVPHCLVFVEDYIVTWRLNKSDYRSGFTIRPIGSSRRPVQFSIGPLTRSSKHFYSISPVKDNILAVSYVEQNASTNHGKRRRLNPTARVNPADCVLKTVFVKVELAHGSVNLKHIDTVEGWFVESSQNFILLAERCMVDDETSAQQIGPIRLPINRDPRRRGVTCSDLAILPVMMENIIIYRIDGEKMRFNSSIPKTTAQLLSNRNATLYDFHSTMNCNVAGNNARIHEINQSEVEIAVIDRAAPGKFTRRLQVYKLAVPANSGKNLALSKKAIMITEPPLCPFASDWRYVDGELMFLRNERIPTLSRSEPNWKASSETILTTLNFVSVDYESGIICRSRQERAYGPFNLLPGYDPEDWAKDNWAREPWVEFSRQFLSSYYLKRGEYCPPASWQIPVANSYISNWF